MEKLNDYINAVMAFIDKIIEKVNNISFLNFKPATKTVAIVFSLAIFLIAAVSGVMVISELSSEDPAEITDAETTQATEVVSSDQVIKGNFLLALTYHDDIELLAVARLDSESKTMKMSFLSPETYCSFNNLSGTMDEHYDNGGITELLWAVGEYAHISIERYILADESAFLSLIEHIGEMQVVLEHSVVCGQDAASFIIEEGQQSLIPAMMTKYFYYLCENQPEYNEEIVDVMAIYSKSLFSAEDENKTKSNFEYMISCLDTNISALDFGNNKEPILSLADPAVLDNVTIEENPANLR